MRDFDPEKPPKPELPSKIIEALTAMLNSDAPLEIEIGCGVGFHPLKQALQNPHKNYIAIEKTNNRFTRFLKRIEHHDSPKNILAIQADAVNFISHYIPADSVDKYYILYPNPYYKKSQENLRWYNRPFIAYLKKTLKPNGLMFYATNLDEFAAEAKKRFQETWNLKLNNYNEITESMNPLTHFEKKYLEAHQKCFHLEFRNLND